MQRTISTLGAFTHRLLLPQPESDEPSQALQGYSPRAGAGRGYGPSGSGSVMAIDFVEDGLLNPPLLHRYSPDLGDHLHLHLGCRRLATATCHHGGLRYSQPL